MSPWTDNPERSKFVTSESQQRMLDEVMTIYGTMGIPIECEQRPVPLHGLIATQDAIEADKFAIVRRKVEAGELEIPVIVEEHFADDEYRRYLIDGHCRVRAKIELGQRSTAAYVLWSPAGDFESNFVRIAAQYGDVLVRDLRMV